MDDIHSCSYYCTKPACVERQRDELREKVFARQWQSLTSTETKVLWMTSNNPKEFAEFIDAKLKEKNAP